MADNRGRSSSRGKNTPKPWTRKDRRKKNRGKKPGPKPGSRNTTR